MKPIIILFCIAAASAGVTHAGLYKCSVNGKVIYQDIPCMGGKQIEVKPAPKVSVEDAQAAEIRLYKDRLWQLQCGKLIILHGSSSPTTFHRVGLKLADGDLIRTTDNTQNILIYCVNSA